MRGPNLRSSFIQVISDGPFAALGLSLLSILPQIEALISFAPHILASRSEDIIIATEPLTYGRLITLNGLRSGIKCILPSP